MHQAVDEVRPSWGEERIRILLTAVVSWFVCLVVAEVDLLTTRNPVMSGYIWNVSLYTNSTVLKCYIRNTSLFKGLGRIAVLWSCRDQFTSDRISNQHVRMRGTSLAPHATLSPETVCTYNAKLEILCVCKSDNLRIEVRERRKGSME